MHAHVWQHALPSSEGVCSAACPTSNRKGLGRALSFSYARTSLSHTPAGPVRLPNRLRSVVPATSASRVSLACR